MKILTKTLEILIASNYGRPEQENDLQADVLELRKKTPWTQEEVDALVADPAWRVEDDGGNIHPKYNYTLPLRHSLYMAQVDPSAAALAAKQLEIEALEWAKADALEEAAAAAYQAQQAREGEEAAVQAKETLQTITIPTLLRGRTDDVLVELLDCMPEWTEGKYVIGDVRKYEGQPKICCQAHDSTGNPSWNPTTASLWSSYHAKSAEYALPWIAPTGAHDVYKTNEYMIYTDTFTYKCLSDTNYSPSEYAQAWQKIV